MTYFIKDQERVKKLTELWKEFPECLKDERQCELYDGQLNVEMLDGSIIHFEPDEFKTQRGHGWHSTREDTPPEGVFLQCDCMERVDNNDKKWVPRHYCLIFSNGRWKYESGARLSSNDFYVEWFRPWDD